MPKGLTDIQEEKCKGYRPVGNPILTLISLETGEWNILPEN